MRRRRLLGLLTTALLLLPTSAFALAPGATGLQVDDVVTVSDSQDGEATGLEVLGTEVTATDGDGEDHLLSTTDADVAEGTAEVTVLGTEVDGDDSSAEAISVRVGGDDGVEVGAVGSSRDEDGAETRGVGLSGQGHDLAVATSWADGDGGGVAGLVMDGTTVAADEDMNGGSCAVVVPEVLRADVACVQSAVDDDGAEHEAAVINDAESEHALGPLGHMSGELLRANGGAASAESSDPSDDPFVPAPTPDPATVTTAPAPDPAASSTPTPGAGVDTALLAGPTPLGGTLPVTGGPVLGLLAVGLGLLGAGTGTLGATRRRRTA